MANLFVIVCLLSVLHSVMAAALWPGVQRFNYSAEFKPEMTGEDFGSALIRNRRQVSLKTAIGWFWDLLGAGKTVFETVIVFYGFIDDTIKKKKLLHLERQMEEIQDQLTDMTDDLTQSHALHLTLATLCVGASVGTKKRSVTSMTDALPGDVMDKIRHKRESRSRRSVNASALIKTFLDVYKYPDVPMNLIQFVSDVIGVFGYGKEPRTVTQLKQQFDDVEEQIEVIKETVEQQAWMMKRHSTPRMPCRKKNFDVRGSVPPSASYANGYQTPSYPGYEAHWTRNRRDLSLDEVMQRFWSFWEYMSVFLTVFSTIAHSKSLASEPEETGLEDFGERLKEIQQNLTDLMTSIEQTTVESRQYFNPDHCEEYHYAKTTTHRPYYANVAPDKVPEESSWNNYIHPIGQHPRFFTDNPIISAVGKKFFPIWKFVKPAFTIFALFDDLVIASGLEKKDPNDLEEIDEQLDDIREKISDLTDGLHIVSMRSLRSALDVCKNVGR